MGTSGKGKRSEKSDEKAADQAKQYTPEAARAMRSARDF